MSRLFLIHHYKEPIIKYPSVPVLDRKKIQSTGLATVGNIVEANQLDNISFTLKRSGRIVRKVESSPPLYMRTWKPMGHVTNTNCENDQGFERSVLIKQRLAETIYILKPMVHLLSMKYFGTTSWKQWIVPLAFDITRYVFVNFSVVFCIFFYEGISKKLVLLFH